MFALENNINNTLKIYSAKANAAKCIFFLIILRNSKIYSPSPFTALSNAQVLLASVINSYTPLEAIERSEKGTTSASLNIYVCSKTNLFAVCLVQH